MELKRYVLGIEKGIIDTKGIEYYIWERNKLCSGGGGVLDIILKTSDNILDLVEVGDLVEYELSTTSTYATKIDKVVPCKRIEDKYFNLQNSLVPYDKVVAIYKLQPNGDYKRYEVKE